MYRSKDQIEAILKKVYNRGPQSVESVCEELGIGRTTIYRWKKEYGYQGDLIMAKKESHKSSKRTPKEKGLLLINYFLTPESERGKFLRETGIYQSDIDNWLEVGTNEASDPKQIQDLKKQLLEKERDLNRKDKALAETTALLVLKKKVHALLGDEES